MKDIQKILDISYLTVFKKMAILMAVIYGIKKRRVIYQSIYELYITTCKIIKTTCVYLKKYKLLLFIIPFNLYVIGFCAVKQRTLGKAPWNLAIWISIFSLLLFIVIYNEGWARWLYKDGSLVKKFGLRLYESFIYFTPLFFLWRSCEFASLYFSDSIFNGCESSVMVLFILLQAGFVVHYCTELMDINSAVYEAKQSIVLFLAIIIHIVQLFVNVYILILVLEHGAIIGLNSTTPLELCFDITYFSAMVFLGGNTVFEIGSRWIQLAVLVETFIFAIYISLIIFNFHGKDLTNKSEKS